MRIRVCLGSSLCAAPGQLRPLVFFGTNPGTNVARKARFRSGHNTGRPFRFECKPLTRADTGGRSLKFPKVEVAGSRLFLLRSDWSDYPPARGRTVVDANGLVLPRRPSATCVGVSLAI
jgi:hypothetical protein